MESLTDALVEMGFDPEDIAALLPEPGFSVSTLLFPLVLVYEVLDLLSRRVPGPASFLGLDHHTAHIAVSLIHVIGM